jgi:hypothetical protein
MHLTRTTLAMVALTVALVPAMSGCGSSGPGPLRAAPPGTSTCIPAKPGQGVTYGGERWTNHTSQTIVFDRVGIRRPQHLKLLGAYATPGLYVVGMWASWPPKGQPEIWLSHSWAHRRLVAGYRLRPGATAGIVLGIESTAPPRGSTPGMLIWYHTASGNYLLRDDYEIIVAEHC